MHDRKAGEGTWAARPYGPVVRRRRFCPWGATSRAATRAAPVAPVLGQAPSRACVLAFVARCGIVGRHPARFCRLTAITQYVIIPMIKSFGDKDTERVFSRQHVRRIPPDLHRAAWRKLAILDAAEQLSDLRVPPGNRLEKLSGDRKGQYSIRINDQWRICFRWHQGDAYEVEIADYH